MRYFIALCLLLLGGCATPRQSETSDSPQAAVRPDAIRRLGLVVVTGDVKLEWIGLTVLNNKYAMLPVPEWEIDAHVERAIAANLPTGVATVPVAVDRQGLLGALPGSATLTIPKPDGWLKGTSAAAREVDRSYWPKRGFDITEDQKNRLRNACTEMIDQGVPITLRQLGLGRT